MKRCLVVLFILVVAASIVACRPVGAADFSVEAGRAAFVQEAEPTMARTVVRTVSMGAGVRFVEDWGDMGVLVCKAEGADTLYGVVRDGAEILSCRYVSLACTGHYYVARYYNDEGMACEVYDRAGTLLVGSTDSAASVAEVDADHFLLYTFLEAQLFDSHGDAVFHDGVFGTADVVSVCGDYFLSFNVDTGVYCVWDGPNVLRHRFAEAGLRYTVAYMGGKFLVTALSAGTADQHTYIESGDEFVFVSQQAWWYDPVADHLTATSLDYVLLSVTNVYTPGLGTADKKALRLQEGYSVAAVAELNGYAVHTGERYYILNDKAERTVRYPAGINATAIYYRSDRGFVSSAAMGGAAVLYDLAGNMVWQNKDHTYAMMCWQSGRFVASYVDDGATRYGAFDSAGAVAVTFVYDYMSPFVEGKCVVRTQGAYYVLSDAGERLSAISLACPEHWLAYGVYVYAEGGRVGVRNFAGDTVIDATWDEMLSIGYTSRGEVYVVAAKDGAQTLLILQ